MKSKLKKILIGAVALSPVAAFATDPTPPLDLTATGATLAGFVPVATAIGVGVFAAIYGVRVIMKSFKTVAK